MASSSTPPPPPPPPAAPVPEDLAFTPEQQTAYDAALVHLNESSNNKEFLALIPKLVSVDAAELPSTEEEDAEDDVVTIISPARGHHELFRALDLLETALEKQEQQLAAKTPLTWQLTALVMGEDAADAAGDSRLALQSLEALGLSVPRRVCQHPFKKNDIVWVCRTCQADETCVLCHACFSQSNHEGHDGECSM